MTRCFFSILFTITLLVYSGSSSAQSERENSVAGDASNIPESNDAISEAQQREQQNSNTVIAEIEQKNLELKSNKSLESQKDVEQFVNSELKKQLGLSPTTELEVAEGKDMPMGIKTFRISQKIHGIPVYTANGSLVVRKDKQSSRYSGKHQEYKDFQMPEFLPLVKVLQLNNLIMRDESIYSLVLVPMEHSLIPSYMLIASHSEKGQERRFLINAVNADIIWQESLYSEATDIVVTDWGKSCDEAGISDTYYPEFSPAQQALFREKITQNSYIDESSITANSNTLTTFKMLTILDFFFRTEFNRDSYDDNGSPLRGFHNVRFTGKDYPYGCKALSWNAMWSFHDNSMYFPDNALDFPAILGHEYGHGIYYMDFDNSKSIVSRREVKGDTGSIGEAVGDLFGFAFFYWLTNNQSLNHKGVSNDFWALDSPMGVLRNIKNPQSVISRPPGYADHTDLKIKVPSDSQFGMYQNSTIISHAFYLAAAGGNKKGIAINALGLKTLSTVMLFSNEILNTNRVTFIEFANVFTDSAKDLYGSNSKEHINIQNAFAAVGLMDKTTAIPTVSSSTPSSPATVNANNFSINYLLALIVLIGFLFFAKRVISQRPQLSVEPSPIAPPIDKIEQPEIIPNKVQTKVRIKIALRIRGKQKVYYFPEKIAENKGIVIGREASHVDLCIPDDSISRKHCVLAKKDGCFYLKDLHSLNGTSVNGNKIDSGTFVKLTEPATFYVNKFAASVSQDIAEK